MGKKIIIFTISSLIFVLVFGFSFNTYAEDSIRNININSLLPSSLPKAIFFISPNNETILEDTIFDVMFFINSNKNNINTIELNIKFSPDKLSIVKPSGGKSLISIWLEPPKYSNTEGTARFVGVIPNGIVTESGLITTITFKAKATGQATVTISRNSRVLANDGAGTEIPVEFGRAIYTIIPKPPEGPKVFSETHPFSDQWYNNNNPVISWEKDLGVTDFSYELDNKPFTIPDNTPETGEIASYQNLPDGLWYFHIKGRKQGVWGATTNFLLRIDTAPPAAFTPTVEALTAKIIDRFLVSFFTTDALSGINHYEVGVIEKGKSPLESPLFIQAESPYQLPSLVSNNLRVIIRAIDNAGNVRDESIDVNITSPIPFFLYLKEHLVTVLIAVLAFIILLIILHYLIGHKIISHFRRALKLLKRVEEKEELDTLKNDLAKSEEYKNDINIIKEDLPNTQDPNLKNNDNLKIEEKN